MMVRSTMALFFATAAVLTLAGCGEKAQTIDSGGVKKSDAKAWEGVAGGSQYTVAGYKAGDKTAWETQLKARTERGQNEYSHKVSAKP
jgi:uncharacterized lipoprotein YehR (DUF1307 family)